MSTSTYGSAAAPTFDVLATLPPTAKLPRKPASRISQNTCESVLSTEVPATKSSERIAKMALIARDARHRIDLAPASPLHRFGRRVVTLTLGLAFLFLSAVAVRIDVRPLRRALNWLASQAPSHDVRNLAASRAAMRRRNLAALLTEYWYGESRIARVTGQAPVNRYVAGAFLAGLAARFEEAGLPTLHLDPRQPRAIDNVFETGEGVYKVVDLESGVFPLPSLKTWGRALRRRRSPFSNEIFFDVTRAYIAREEESMRAKLGDAWVASLHATLDAAESGRRTPFSVTESPSISTPPMPLRLPTPLDLSCSPQRQAA
jgi:hypothetical protein